MCYLGLIKKKGKKNKQEFYFLINKSLYEFFILLIKESDNWLHIEISIISNWGLLFNKLIKIVSVIEERPAIYNSFIFVKSLRIFPSTDEQNDKFNFFKLEQSNITLYIYFSINIKYYYNSNNILLY